MTPAEIRAQAEIDEAAMPDPTPEQIDRLAALLRPPVRSSAA